MEEAADVVATVVESETMMVKYSVADAFIAEMKDKYKDMKADTPTAYKAITEALGVVRKTRTTLEKERKFKNKDVIKLKSMIDTEAKRLTSDILEVEEPLKATKAAVDDEKARIKQEQEEAEAKRISDIQKKISDMREMKNIILDMSADSEKLNKQLVKIQFIFVEESEYMEFTEEADVVQNNTMAEVEKALNNRITYEREQKEQKDEAARLLKQKEEQDAKETEFAAEQDAFEKKKADAAEAEQAKIDAEQKVKDDAELKIKLENEATEKAERELKEKQDKDAADKIAEEERLAEIEAAKPDKEKINIWMETILINLNLAPTLDTASAQELINDIVSEIKQIIEDGRKVTF